MPVPDYAAVTTPGLNATGIGEAAAAGEITALHLFGTDPVRDAPNRGLWERAMRSAALVVAHASVLTEGLAEHATVIFPAESYAEKEGTLVHPDGRLQRQRIAIAYPGEVRAGWWVLTEIAAACGLDTGVRARRGRLRAVGGGGAVLRGADARGDRRARSALARAPRGPVHGAQRRDLAA